MGPKTVALVYSALGVSDLDGLDEAAKDAVDLNKPLPRMGQKFTDQAPQGHRRSTASNSSRFRIDVVAKEYAERISAN